MNTKGAERVEFTSKMRRDYTILAPDIFPLHLRLIKEVFINQGYNFDFVTYQGTDVIEKGLESIHNDMCYPLICTAGQLIYALECGDWDKSKTALIQFQTGGGCRASNYIWLLRKALSLRGLGDVPVISLSFNSIEKNSGFRLTLPFLLKGLVSVVYSDMLMCLSNQTRPYEENKGESDELIQKWIDTLSLELKSSRHILKNINKNLREIALSFSKIKRNNTKKVKVGIVGEIYVKFSPFGNNNLQKFLEDNDCEVMIPGVFPFAQYCFQNKIYDHNSYGLNSYFTTFICKVLLKYCKKIDKSFRDALKGLDFVIPSSFDELVENAKEVFDTHIEMGEGWLLPAESAELAKNGYDNIISTQPFGCLPNHIVAKGFAKKFKTVFPNATLCPIDYDSSQSKVNQENRIRLMLSIAKERLYEENRT